MHRRWGGKRERERGRKGGGWLAGKEVEWKEGGRDKGRCMYVSHNFLCIVVVVFSSSFSILSAPDYKVGMQQTST